MTSVDWNVFVHTLETLAEGGYSFVELDDYMSRHHGKVAVRDALALLVRQGLVRVLKMEAHDGGYQEFKPEEQRRLAEHFLEVAFADRQSTASNCFEVTDLGKDLMRLVGLSVSAA